VLDFRAHLRTAGALLAVCALYSTSSAHADTDGFSVLNDTDQIVLEVRVNRGTDEGWGRDLLGIVGMVNPGQSSRLSFDAGDKCVYDVVITTNPNGERRLDYRYLRGVDLCSTGSISVSQGEVGGPPGT
jgi:hypothetical protein